MCLYVSLHVDGLAGGEASSFIKRLASGLAVHWDKHITVKDFMVL